jgi:hypothetical protein
MTGRDVLNKCYPPPPPSPPKRRHQQSGAGALDQWVSYAEKGAKKAPSSNTRPPRRKPTDWESSSKKADQLSGDGWEETVPTPATEDVESMVGIIKCDTCTVGSSDFFMLTMLHVVSDRQTISKTILEKAFFFILWCSYLCLPVCVAKFEKRPF